MCTRSRTSTLFPTLCSCARRICSRKYQISDFTMGKDDFLVIWHAAQDKNLSSLEKACLAFLVKNGKLLKTWSYPSFLTHEQALKVIQYGMDNFSVVPPLFMTTRTDAYDPVTVVGDGHLTTKTTRFSGVLYCAILFFATYSFTIHVSMCVENWIHKHKYKYNQCLKQLFPIKSVLSFCPILIQ